MVGAVIRLGLSREEAGKPWRPDCVHVGRSVSENTTKGFEIYGELLAHGIDNTKMVQMLITASRISTAAIQRMMKGEVRQ